MKQLLILAFPFAVMWVFVTDRLTLDGFLIGYVLSIAILLALGGQHVKVSLRRLPRQCFALLIYTLLLSRDIFLSAFDVARRVLAPRIPLATGIVLVPTQDDDAVIAALSAHSITITPGELVVDFKGTENMYVHCLDVYASAAKLNSAQAQRVALFRRILGHD
jgi:multicomponent Na+:H+ antiporter subunit E